MAPVIARGAFYCTDYNFLQKIHFGVGHRWNTCHFLRFLRGFKFLIPLTTWVDAKTQAEQNLVHFSAIVTWQNYLLKLQLLFFN